MADKKNINLNDYAFRVTAAGRVNVIGEHVDYCGGKVFPAALTLNNAVYVRPNGTNKVNLSWTTLDSTVTLDLDKLESYVNLKYGNYQAGSLLKWRESGHALIGCDMVQDCGVPFGSGLSSSAAIEVSTIAAMCAITNTHMDKVQIALQAQRAEREYVGVNCGIMDQYASACGKAGNAMLLDCNSLECEYVPVDTGDCSLVIANCCKPHSLVESKYNERRAETEQALNALSGLGISCLAQVTPNMLESAQSILTPAVFKRVKHVAEECERVRLAAKAMKTGDMAALGKLLNASHESLQKLYEVTGNELDALAYAAQAHPSCLGSRMTGGGFGGCTVSLVRSDDVEDFKKFVAERYTKQTGYIPEFYKTEIGDGITVQKL